MTRKFEFKKTYEEIEVGGEVFKMYFDDNKMKEYQASFIKLRDDYSKLLKVDEKQLTDEKAMEHFEDIKSVAEKALDTLLGENSFGHIYEASGNSIANVYDFVWYLAEIVNERTSRNVQDKKDKYLKKKKVKK
jgi:hypothetical protein